LLTSAALLQELHSLQLLGAERSRAEELGEFGFESGLHEQAHPEASDAFEDVAAIPVAGEQLVDVSTDPLDGRYSGGHRRGFSFLSSKLLEGTHAGRPFTPRTGRHPPEEQTDTNAD
jgi:hypothetical protein